jgi:tetratricopeptide (TPR) repeat protein
VKGGRTVERSSGYDISRGVRCALCGGRPSAMLPPQTNLVKSESGTSVRQNMPERVQSATSNHDSCERRAERADVRSPMPSIRLESSPSLIERRRFVLLPFVLCGALAQSGTAAAWVPAKIDLSASPRGQFDTSDAGFREVASLFQQALSTDNVQTEERLWSEIISLAGDLQADWVPDILARAYGNRGNARSRQGKREEALQDYDQSIQLAP